MQKINAECRFLKPAMFIRLAGQNKNGDRLMKQTGANHAFAPLLLAAWPAAI
ncbi:hypothetical protein [Paraburkholderia sp. GAS42]|uniref:hypothetical protein n=1 Tax=Paraburkholderia sp. GAS42 TaxID=3035135 RepID=UPI003D2567D1